MKCIESRRIVAKHVGGDFWSHAGASTVLNEDGNDVDKIVIESKMMLRSLSIH